MRVDTLTARDRRTHGRHRASDPAVTPPLVCLALAGASLILATVAACAATPSAPPPARPAAAICYAGPTGWCSPTVPDDSIAAAITIGDGRG